MASSTPPRTLADQLRGWPDASLLGLIASRPDLATPAPADSAQLASRAGTRASVVRAVDQLTVLELGVAEAAVGVGRPVALPVLQAQVNAAPDRVAAAVSVLRGRVLLWGSDDALRPLSVLADALALRGGRTTREPLDGVPEPATSQREQAVVDRAAAGAAFEVVRHVELMLEHWGTAPPVALRGGGLGVRDLRATADLLHVGQSVAALHIEVAAAAGLVAVGETAAHGSAWLPTHAFDVWKAGTLADRWVRLALAWLQTPRLTGLVGTRDVGDKPVNALVPGLEQHWVPETRRMCLEEMGQLPVGDVLATGTGPDSLLARLQWLRPRRPPVRSRAVGWVLEEAAAIGVTALGGLAAHGRALLAADDPRRDAPAALAPLLPEPVDHVLLQADLTAVAPGPLEQELAHGLATMADVESRGGATVYRFTASSVRRAFDSGWAAQQIHEFVAASSRTPVPQPLSYLVDDVSRRFGKMRVGAAESFVRSDDESALTELLHNPKALSLRLRRLAPTVLVSDVPVDVLLPRLRELGAAPVVEALDGSVRTARKDSQRATSTPPPREAERDPAKLAVRRSATVSAIRAGDRVSAARPARPNGSRHASPAVVLAALREAADAKQTVWIGYVDNQGASGERVVDPVHVHAGQLTAYDHRVNDVRLFAVHRITGVGPLPEDS